MPDQEQVSFDIDPRSVLGAIKQMNSAMEGYEKTHGSANENRVVIGFSDPESDGIAHVNNLRERAFGVSPEDRKALTEIVLATLRMKRIVAFRKVA